MRTSLLLLVGIAAVICAVAAPAAALLGGWEPIKNVDDPDIQELGEWAVAEHVKRANDGLKFKKVVSGMVQTVAGVNYRLAIHALNLDGEEGAYRAVVHDEPSPSAARKLVSFSTPRSTDPATAGRKD